MVEGEARAYPRQFIGYHHQVRDSVAGRPVLVTFCTDRRKGRVIDPTADGRPVGIHSPNQARALGIGMVFQHFSLFETLTVVENVALSLPGKPDLDDLASRIRAVSMRYGLQGRGIVVTATRTRAIVSAGR
mgnify:CR=1 FL=1